MNHLLGASWTIRTVNILPSPPAQPKQVGGPRGKAEWTKGIRTNAESWRAIGFPLEMYLRVWSYQGNVSSAKCGICKRFWRHNWEWEVDMRWKNGTRCQGGLGECARQTEAEIRGQSV